jgi:hypothetical protein
VEVQVRLRQALQVAWHRFANEHTQAGRRWSRFTI